MPVLIYAYYGSIAFEFNTIRFDSMNSLELTVKFMVLCNFIYSIFSENIDNFPFFMDGKFYSLY